MDATLKSWLPQLREAVKKQPPPGNAQLLEMLIASHEEADEKIARFDIRVEELESELADALFAVGEVSRPAPPLTIRDIWPAVDARVARAADAVNRWFTIHGYFQFAESAVACSGIAHDVLAASTADAAPAVDWQSERPGKDCKSCVESGTTCTAGNGNYPACFRPKPSWTTTRPNKKGWYWQRYVGRVKASPAHFETDVGGSVWIAHGLNTEECDVEYWPVPIPEPPTTKGEGGR